MILKTSAESTDRADELSTSEHKEKFICLTMTASDPEAGISLLPESESDDSGWKLETARQIALRHKGWIDVNPGSGLPELRVHLPAVNECDRAVEKSGAVEEIKGGTETILLVEDEDFLRRVSALSLRKLGYAVLDAVDGDAALKLWEKHHAKIDLLLSDLMLPGAESGYDLAQLFTSQKPSLRVMLSSGNHADLAEVTSLSGPAFFPAIKPYTASRLATMVRECLDSST